MVCGLYPQKRTPPCSMPAGYSSCLVRMQTDDCGQSNKQTVSDCCHVNRAQISWLWFTLSKHRQPVAPPRQVTPSLLPWGGTSKPRVHPRFICTESRMKAQQCSLCEGLLSLLVHSTEGLFGRYFIWDCCFPLANNSLIDASEWRKTAETQRALSYPLSWFEVLMGFLFCLRG